ncbi:hypothetical protein LSH36_220g00046 [Paralvinella palmiformis]|uniref:Uncharacterized protein n=1 Tax=Paralvinella palmiformis TaxID=53620 RepID=A0AAD9JPD4_9ANNE|nr:hypothetical protein LSH36_220g00046 [Paralvinella palmiformis]
MFSLVISLSVGISCFNTLNFSESWETAKALGSFEFDSFRQSDIDKSDTHIELTKELNIEEPFIKEFISDESVSDEEVVVKESNSKEPRALAVSHDSEKSVQIQTVRECFSVESPRESETKQPFYEECVSVASARDKDFIIKQSILNEQKTLTVIQDSVKFIQTQTVREFAGVESPEESDTKEPFVEEVISTGSDSDEGVIVKESIPNDLRQLAVSHDSEISVQTQNVKDFVGFESPMEIDTKQPFDEKCISIASSRDEVIFKESVAKELRNLTVIQDSLRVIETQTDREDDIKQTFVEEGISVGSGRYEDVSVESPRQSESVSDEDVIGKESITKDLKTLSITLHTKKSIQAQTHVNFEYPNNTEQSAFEEYVSSESVSDEDVTGKESITKDLKTLTSILHVKKSIQAQTDRELVDVEYQKATEQPAFEEYVSSESISDEDVIGKESIIKELKTLSITLHTKKSIQAQTDRELVDVEYPNNTEQSAFEEYVSSESVSDEDVIGKESITKDLKTLSLILHIKKSIETQTNKEPVDVESQIDTEQSSDEEYVSSESISDEDVIGKESITKELKTRSITLPKKSIQAPDREQGDIESQSDTEQSDFEEYVSIGTICDDVLEESTVKERGTLAVILDSTNTIQTQADIEFVDVGTSRDCDTEQLSMEESVSIGTICDDVVKESTGQEMGMLAVILDLVNTIQTQTDREFTDVVSLRECETEQLSVEEPVPIQIVHDEDVTIKESVAKETTTLSGILDSKNIIQTQTDREYIDIRSSTESDIKQLSVEESVAIRTICHKDVIVKELTSKKLSTLPVIQDSEINIQTQTGREFADVDSSRENDTKQLCVEESVSIMSVSEEVIVTKESSTLESMTLAGIQDSKNTVQTQIGREFTDVESSRESNTKQLSNDEYVSMRTVCDEDVIVKKSTAKEPRTLVIILDSMSTIQTQTNREFADVEPSRKNHTDQSFDERCVPVMSVCDEDIIVKELSTHEPKTLDVIHDSMTTLQTQTDREPNVVESSTEKVILREYGLEETFAGKEICIRVSYR